MGLGPHLAQRLHGLALVRRLRARHQTAGQARRRRRRRQQLEQRASARLRPRPAARQRRRARLVQAAHARGGRVLQLASVRRRQLVHRRCSQEARGALSSIMLTYGYLRLVLIVTYE